MFRKRILDERERRRPLLDPQIHCSQIKGEGALERFNRTKDDPSWTGCGRWQSR